MLARGIGIALAGLGVVLALRMCYVARRDKACCTAPAQRRTQLVVLAGLFVAVACAAAAVLPGTYMLLAGAAICLSCALAATLAGMQAAALRELGERCRLQQREQEGRVNAVILQDTLIKTVNEVAAALLDADVESFDDTLSHCMEKLGQGVRADRVYLWKNHLQGGELYCTQIHEWSGGAEPQQGNELTVSVPFPGDWYSRLSANRCVNGVVAQFPAFEREHLQAQGIVSILVVPVFLHGEFWGFVGFDDCRCERVFSPAEESILRSGSLLFAVSLLRNEMTQDLVVAREQALASARARAEFLANMSHEIRTPINAITGMAQIARKSGDMAHIWQCVDRIDTAARQLLALVNDVLDMSKIDAGKLELARHPFDLRATLHNIDSIIGVQAAEKDQQLAIEWDTLPEVVVGDETRLMQVLINLLSNAVKFTPSGGSIRMQARQLRERDGRAELEIAVTDTGIGISAAQIDRLFAKFEQVDHGPTRRFGGTGLGLAISRSIAEMMDGGITASSVPGRGSCFTARLWVGIGQRAAPEQAGKTGGDLDLAGYRALLVEDIEINREIVVALLADTGLRIDQVCDGQAAVEAFGRQPDRYDLIFMDLQMPVMDGYTATRKIRAMDSARARTVPIIAMTANAFSEDIDRCLAAGMNDHIAKPIEYGLLQQKIERNLPCAAGTVSAVREQAKT